MMYTTHRSPLRRWYICSAGLLGLALFVSLATGTFQLGRNSGRNVAEASSLPESASTVPDRHSDPAPAKRGSSSTVRAIETYGRLPLSFERNDGQVNPEVKFLARGRGYTLFLTGKEAVLALEKPSAVSSQLSARGKWKIETRNSKLENGNWKAENGNWKLGNRNWSPLSLESAISNLRFLVSSLEYPAPPSIAPAPTPPPSAPDVLRLELVGANPQARVAGLDELPGKSNYFIGNDPKKWRTNVPAYAKVRYANVYPGIDLVYYGKNSEVRSQKPEGESEAVAEWRAQLEYDFVVAPGADPKRIKLSFAGADGMRVDAASGDFVLKVGADEVRFQKPTVYQPTVAAVYDRRRRSQSAATAQLDGSFLLADNRIGFEVRGYDRSRPLIIDPLVLSYSTYLGGRGSNQGASIALDNSGNAYVTGWTTSADFPTVNPIQATNGGDGDAFVAEINAAGSALVYSTYLGGSGLEYGYGIAVDSAGNAYVTGFTQSTNFPTVNPLQAACGGCGEGNGDAFVAKLNPGGSALVYSTYLDGSTSSVGQGIAADSAGNAYVTGGTSSTDFPTVNPIQAKNRATNDASNSSGGTSFVAKLNAVGSALVYSTYLGGSSSDRGVGIAVDGSGSAYVTGWTYSTDFPTVGPLQAMNHASVRSSFVAKLNGTGSALVYSTYLGGSDDNIGFGIAVDGSGNAYVAGFTSSPDFPTVKPLQPSFGGGGADAFVAKLNAAGSALVFSTYLGGSGADFGQGIAVDIPGSAYVIGSTDSTDFPTASPIQGVCESCGPASSDAFVSKLNPAGSALVYSTYLGGIGAGYGTGIAVDSSGNAYVTGSTSGPGFPTVNPLQETTLGEGAFVAMLTYLPPSAITLTPGTLSFATQLVGTTSAAQTVTVTNSSDASLTISPVALTGTNAGDFTNSADTCSGATLSPNGTCAVTVSFAPTAPGTRTASLTITDSADVSPQTVTLTGTATPPTVLLSTAALSFGNQVVGTTSAAQMATFSANGLVSITSIALAGPNSGDFAQSNACGGSVAAGASCTINVTFTPTAGGTRTGTLTITSNAGNSPQITSLTGTGILGPLVTLSPTNISFPNQYVGTSGLPINVTLTNSGDQPLTISSVQAGGDFGATSGCTSNLSAGVNCSIGVFFDPSASGLRSGTLTITDNAPGSPQSAALSGTGEDFSVAAAPGSSTSATVTAGQMATYKLSVAPLSGLSGSVILTCNGAPSQATCTLNPSSVSLSGSAAVPTTVTVSTMAPSAVGMRPKPPAGPWIGLWILGLLAAAGARLMGGRRLAWRRAWAPLAVAMMLSLTLWAACGGGPAPTALQQPGTPAGNYTLTVTGSYTAGATTLNHILPLKLTVH